VGGSGNTSSYDTKSGMWRVGPSLPAGLFVDDGPGALLPDGTVLFAAGPADYGYGVRIFQFDGKNLIEQPPIPNAQYAQSEFLNMLILPTGQIFTTNENGGIQVFTMDVAPDANSVPSIVHYTRSIERGQTYKITGTKFNGMSQGAFYGDDAQSASNYPIVRIRNGLHVFYCRTHDHSFMGVAYSGSVSTYFDVPESMDVGENMLLYVVANGIPSKPVKVTVS